jgi:hypothetical protein
MNTEHSRAKGQPVTGGAGLPICASAAGHHLTARTNQRFPLRVRPRWSNPIHRTRCALRHERPRPSVHGRRLHWQHRVVASPPCETSAALSIRKRRLTAWRSPAARSASGCIALLGGTGADLSRVTSAATRSSAPLRSRVVLFLQLCPRSTRLKRGRGTLHREQCRPIFSDYVDLGTHQCDSQREGPHAHDD